MWTKLTLGRYHLHYHSPAQILAGYSIGVVTGAAYFAVTQGIPLYFPSSMSSRIRKSIGSLWEGFGGIAGWDLGDAAGGWGEGWMFVDEKDVTLDSARKRL